MYDCRVLADSLNPVGVRLTTLLVQFPRIVLAEFNTHRMFSRNSASSRAIPVEKRIEAVRQNPFIPAAFGSNKRGMQAGPSLENDERRQAEYVWFSALQNACNAAEALTKAGVHKQWANRLIEPFCWHQVIVTATEWDNFFHLRISPEAQPEIQAAAIAMKKAMDESQPKQLEAGGWHLPFLNAEDFKDLSLLDIQQVAVKLSSARCARVSYVTHDGYRDPTQDIRLHDQLLQNGHMSPFEHPARAEHDREFRGNFRGFTQYRKMIPNEQDRLGRRV